LRTSGQNHKSVIPAGRVGIKWVQQRISAMMAPSGVSTVTALNRGAAFAHRAPCETTSEAPG